MMSCTGTLGLRGAEPAAAADDDAPAAQEDWRRLFNGQNLNGWVPKIVGSDAAADPLETFRVVDGVLKVDYSNYGAFDGRFGHLFYQLPYSYYRLRFEYRFTGEQADGGPGKWAQRNSGVMVHAQSPDSMLEAQAFPLSIEAQLLGGLSDGNPRPTGNVCTPGTEIVYSGHIYPEHCLYSSSATFDGDDWVSFEVRVLGSAQIAHAVNGDWVLAYELPQFGGSGVATGYDPAVKRTGELLAAGYIALQSESHPIEFKNIELLELVGCMDPDSSSYRSYFVKSAPDRCN